MNNNLKNWKDALGTDSKVYKQLVQEREAKVASFLEFDPARTALSGRISNPDSSLNGLPFAVKDNIAVKNFHCTCGSKMLETFVSPYDATVIERLQNAGAVVIAKANMDEFGMGSSTDNSAFKKTHNPWDLTRVAGGSSGGSAAAVAAGLVPFALGSDTGGSVRQPAAFCGTYGLKPTYGSVSRYGLVAYASSLEVVGAVAKDLDVLEAVFNTMKGIDERDHTTVDISNIPRIKTGVKKVGVLKVEAGLDSAVAEAYKEFTKGLVSEGYEIVDVELPTLEYAVPAYYTIASAEASANLARYNGIRYGHRPIFSENPDELVRKARDEGFGPEVKLRVILGTYVLRSGFQDQYYGQAQKVRTAIRADFDRVFKSVDVIAMPVFPTAAFRHGNADLDAFQQKVADKFTTVANLTGQPALTVPGPVKNGLPIGFQFMAPEYHEELCFEIARKIAMVFPLQSPEAFPAVYG